jgi:hypothetical protein
MAARKPVFELTQDQTHRRTKSSPTNVHRFLVRLLSPVNETLRRKAMYRGDLSEMVIQSLDSVDLRAVPLVALKWGEEDYCGLTVQIPMKLRDRLIAASKQRNVSINSLINTALVHWLAEQGDVTIKGRTGGQR